jgi:flagellar motor protein MotB
MQKVITQMIVAGYGAGETNFLFRLGQSDPQVQLDFENEIIQPLVAVLNSADQTAVLTITGHSDRVDTEGLSREQRRQQELDASSDRAKSADYGVKNILHSRFQGMLPVDLDDIDLLAIVFRAAGAAVLWEKGSSLSAAQRRQNRRVQFRVIRFVPD